MQGLMFNSPVEEIKNRLDIVDVVGSYIKLEKAGANYRALCPFHSEKKPSFFVSPTRQTWHCFGSCGEGGDIFSFVMKVEGIEFGDALRILAQKAGVELRKQDPKFAELKTERQRLYEICELAAYFFEKQLEAGEMGKLARKYLLDRGISEESIKEWSIGYAPNAWQGLSDFLKSKNYKGDEIIRAGLAIAKEKNPLDSFDRFRGRIMFPIRDLAGQVVGFTGRIFGDNKDTAKYVNSPSALLYDKSKILYGLDKAKMAIRKANVCILVEGQTDVIMSRQAGIENVVATSGTALTSYQLVILKRYSENLITAFDMDLAGGSATKRGIDLARVQGFNIKVAMMPEGKDPADIVSQNPEQWKEITEKTKSILDFYFDTAFAGNDANTAEGKKEISKILLPALKKIPNRIEQSHWIQELSGRLNTKQEDIETEMKKIQITRDFQPEQSEQNNSSIQKEKKTRKQMLEERITGLLMKNPKNISIIDDKLFLLFSQNIQIILQNLKKDPDFFQKKCSGAPEINEFLDKLCFMAEEESEDVKPEQEIQTCLDEIQSLETKAKLDAISMKIKQCERDNNQEEVEKLTKEFQDISQKLNSIV
jgi:DNA primase